MTRGQFHHVGSRSEPGRAAVSNRTVTVNQTEKHAQTTWVRKGSSALVAFYLDPYLDPSDFSWALN
jgi:hypothetical protein